MCVTAVCFLHAHEIGTSVCDHQVYRAFTLMLTLNLSNIQQHRRLSTHLSGSTAFVFLSLCVGECRPSLEADRLRVTMQLSASVPFRSACVPEKHMALLVPTGSLACLWRFRTMGVNFFNLRQKEYHEFVASDVHAAN